MIYIYNGTGASRESIRHTKYIFEKITPHVVKFLDAKDLIEGDWIGDAKLLIIPGGADVPYVRKLNGKGNQIIRSFVERGGAYLGICAGGYYATAYVEFDKGGPLEVLGARELNFFPGKTIGPILADHDYNSNQGVRAAVIEFHAQKLQVYFSGGPYFENAASYPNVEILSTYQNPENLNQAAIVKTRVKKGNVILSGVHFEYCPELLDSNDPYLSKVIPNLTETDDLRINMVRAIAKELNLQLR